MSVEGALPAEDVLRERLHAGLSSMDQRTRASKQAQELLEESVKFTRQLRLKTAAEVADAVAETREATRRAQAAEAEVERLKEAAELRRSGQEQPGQEVRFQQPRVANGRDWALAEIEEICFRLRVAGCVDNTRMTVAYNQIESYIPTNTELIPSKAELAAREQHRQAERRSRRNRVTRRAAAAIPISIIGVPVALAVIAGFKFTVSFFWGLL